MRKAGVLAVLAVVAVPAAHAEPSASPRAGDDVTVLAAALEGRHPDLFRHVSRARFRAEVGRLARRAPGSGGNELLVGIVRIGALPGPRNGHTGLFPLDPGRRRPLHLYPLRLYDFVDGLFVVGEAGDVGLVGSKLVAVEGLPSEKLLRLVAPLVPRDNAWNLRAWAPHFALVAEVLDGPGVGVEGGTGPRDFTFERSGGERVSATLATSVSLPVTGWNVRIATRHTERGGPADRRLAVDPGVRVDLTSPDYLAGRDPVLERALRGP